MPSGSKRRSRRVHRRVSQSAAVALSARLSPSGRIRAKSRMPGRKSRRNDRGFCEQREQRKDFERAAEDGDSNAVPFPRPLLLLEDARTLLQKRKLCPKICATKGVHPRFCAQVAHKCSHRPKILAMGAAHQKLLGLGLGPIPVEADSLRPRSVWNSPSGNDLVGAWRFELRQRGSMHSHETIGGACVGMWSGVKMT